MSKTDRAAPNLGKPRYKPLPDDEGVDRIELQIVNRYKTSGLSGDEWRTSAVVTFYRKGKAVGTREYGDLKAAAMCLPGEMLRLYDIVEPRTALWGLKDGECAQPACDKEAVTLREIQKEFSAHGEGPLPDSSIGKPRRAFCMEHKTRGDCSREDCDDNYREVAE